MKEEIVKKIYFIAISQRSEGNKNLFLTYFTLINYQSRVAFENVAAIPLALAFVQLFNGLSKCHTCYEQIDFLFLMEKNRIKCNNNVLVSEFSCFGT